MRIRLLTLLPLAALAASAQQTTVADIYYTGRLLGHARIPAQQETTTRICDAQHACKASDEADILLKLLKDSGYTHGANQLLLGLGDNFGPNYGARTMLDSAPVRYRNTKGQETSGQAMTQNPKMRQREP
jgi:hypothetical protein